MLVYDIGKDTNRKGVRYETENVAFTIEDFAKKRGVPADKIDFDILSVTTTVKRTEIIGNSTEEMVVFEKKGVPDISEEIWLDNDVTITQRYEILLYPFNPTAPHLHIGVATNTYVTNIAAFIKKDEHIIAGEGFDEFVVNELNKKKLKHGFFINIFDEHMKSDINKLSEIIWQRGKLDKDVKVSLFMGPDFIPSIDDRIEYVYQTKSKNPGLSAYIGVSAGDTLVEYIKPQMGKASRNAKGKYINCYEPVKTHEVTFTAANTIKVEENEEKVVYSAINAGFAVFENHILDIKPELSLSNLSVKSGAIDTGTNQSAKIEISQTGDDVDAVGDGVKLKAFELYIKGNVGADTYLEGTKIIIDGRTHRSSTISGKQIDIKTNKGIVNGDDVKIGILEGGEVNANTARITSILGSKLNASECMIDILGSNSTITISKLLTIDSVSGSENKIIVSPIATKEDEEEFSEILSKLTDIKKRLEVSDFKLKENLKTIEQSLPGAKALKSKIDNEKNKEIIAPLVSRLQAFNDLVEKTKILKKENSDLAIQKETLAREIEAKQDKLLQARVIATKDWRGHNTIKFKILEPPQELSVTVDEKNNYAEIFLHKINDIYELGFEKR